MTGWLLALALLQQPPPAPQPQVIASVDRDHVSQGDEIVFTVRVTSQSIDPLQIVLPSLIGLEIISRSERTEVSYGGGPTRVTVLQLRLRALQLGRLRIGPLQVRQGSAVVQGDAVDLVVAEGVAGIANGLNPRLQRLLERAPPPQGEGRVGLSLVLSSDSVTLGDQVDVLTTAWFPRDLRMQLRRPPTLEAPQVDGVWSYPQPAPTGIAASRMVGDAWYDLFVIHQIIFPLSPGQVRISPATLHYSVPVAFQFFSQEERYSLSSGGATVRVSALPDVGRPAGYAGAVGHQLRLRRTVVPLAGKAGEPFTVDLTVEGEGNVALWPTPSIGWPAGLRAYPDRTDDSLAPIAGRMAGSKTFRYLVVPDSAGTVILPMVSYPYFDPTIRSYGTASVDGVTLTVAPGNGRGVARALPPPLMFGSHPPLAWTLLHGLSGVVWIVVALIPPIAYVVPRLPRPRRAVEVNPPQPDDLVEATRRLTEIVAALAPDAITRSERELAQGLQAAGLSAALAADSARLYERLNAARFSPTASDRAALVAEVKALLPRLGRQRASAAGRWTRVVTLLAALLVARRGAGQAPPAEQLYDAGALEEAAAGFAKRTEAEPAVPAHWYNLGAAQFRSGEDGLAAASWTIAHRLAPRDHAIRRALQLVPAPDAGTDRWLWTAPVTPEELLLLAIAAWLVGWAGLFLRPKPGGRWLVLIVAGPLVAAAAGGLEAWYHRPVALVASDSKLRVSPHGRAPELFAEGKGTAVLIRRDASGWRLVRDAAGREGWLETSAIVSLDGRR